MYVKNYSLIENYLIHFLHEEVTKTGLSNVVVGISGGIDSAVVAVLAKKAFGDKLLGVMMPASSSSKSSLDDAKELCEKFDINFIISPIGNLVNTYFQDKKTTPLRKGNFAARMRMTTLYDISAEHSALVLGTSNKSELMLGYGTLHGDLASAINPIGDLYKTEVFALARHLGVPKSIIEKPPSADLWEGQSDEDDLGYTYAIIDEVLEKLVDNRLQKSELLEQNYEENLVDMLQHRIYQNQFKRRLPIIAKIHLRTIGHDFLYPRDIKL